jgi:hypothetical protein
MDLVKNVHNYLNTKNVIRIQVKSVRQSKESWIWHPRVSDEEYTLGQQKELRLRSNCISDEYVKTQWQVFLLYRLSRTLHGTQYTHHSLKHMLPQHCDTYNDVFLLIKFTKV